MSPESELLRANDRFRSAFRYGQLPRSPRRGLVVITCMDARLDPLAMLGLEIGDANVLRNAGGIVTGDVLRSLVVAHAVLGARGALVIGHTECGLQGATNEELRALAGTGEGVDFLPFADVEESVRAGVQRIQESELLPGSFTAEGHVYDVRSGRLRALSSG